MRLLRFLGHWMRLKSFACARWVDDYEQHEHTPTAEG